MVVSPPFGRRECLVVITPDALVRHLGSPVIERLRDNGFEVVTHRLLWTPPVEIDAFHRRHATVAADRELYRLADALFELGPSLVLLLTHSGVPDERAMFELMHELKGRGDPAYAAPGSIRHDLGAVNTILNIVHATDSAAETAREKEIFLAGQPDRGGEEDVADTLALVERVLPRETRSFDALVGGVRGRVLAALWDELAPAGRRQVAAWLDRGPEWLAGATLAQPVSTHLGSRHSLLRVLDTEFVPESGVDWDELDKIITVGGVVLDRWEWLVLATSLRFRSLHIGHDKERAAPS